MSDALEQLKRDLSALRQAYLDCGGKIGDGRDHNSCPFCGDASGFMLRQPDSGPAVWACYAGKSPKCSIPPSRKTCGTIIDLLMQQFGVDSKEASKRALARYGRAAGAATSSTSNSQPQAAPARTKGKLHLTPDLAIESLIAGISKGVEKATQGGYWKYENEKGEPVLGVLRVNVVKKGEAGKEFRPIHRDANGWRVGLGEWGRSKKVPLYRLPKLLKALNENAPCS